LGVQEDENIKDPLKGVRTIVHNKITVIDGGNHYFKQF
jgi:hypothetical protein